MAQIISVHRRAQKLAWHRKNYRANREACIAQVTRSRAKNWDHYLLYARKMGSKYRGLGFHPLNNRFAESHGHHLNKTFMVFIPQRLHTSIKHSIKTGNNMNKINKIALSYLFAMDELQT